MAIYTPPTVTVDGIVFQLINDALHVLLVKRSKDPFKGQLALPGSYVSKEESVNDALHRTLHIKAGIKVDDCGIVEQLYTFDTAMRDPRGHAVTIAYMALCKDITPIESSATEQPIFLPIDKLPTLAFDHNDIVTYAQMRLRGKITYTNAVFALLPRQFTLTQLQGAYESILGTGLDKRNFRKKFLSLDLIEPTEKYQREGAYRPARLYVFKQQKLHALSRSFD